jgi:hypothetical protein
VGSRVQTYLEIKHPGSSAAVVAAAWVTIAGCIRMREHVTLMPIRSRSVARGKCSASYSSLRENFDKLRPIFNHSTYLFALDLY